MKLRVSTWYPWQHLASAMMQLLGNPDWELADLSDGDCELIDDGFGPFLMLVDPDDKWPLVGVPAIIEAMDRKYPDRKWLPREPIARALSRALGGRIEECLTRMALADIESHNAFTRPIWHSGSDARAAILDDYPMRVDVLEEFQRRGGTRYLAGHFPTLADCLLAALWWTAEDQGLDDVLSRQPHLKQWHEANCHGEPFIRSGTKVGERRTL